MTAPRTGFSQLQHIPNVGPAIAANLRLIGITVPQDLLGKDPYVLYEELCRSITETRHDPCVIDVFISQFSSTGLHQDVDILNGELPTHTL